LGRLDILAEFQIGERLRSEASIDKNDQLDMTIR
jgi:hypothetical protein